MTAFIIPMMFLQCLIWPVSDGDVIENFKFEQPVIIRADGPLSVKVRRNEFNLVDGCFSVEAKHHAYVSIEGPLIINGGAVH